MKTTLRLAAIAIAFAAPAALSAQGFIGIHGLASLPMTEMKTKGYAPGGGIGLEVLSNPLNARNGETPRVQFHLGMGGYYLSTGIRRYELKLDTPQGGMADVNVNNNVFALQVVGRASTMLNKYIGTYGDVFGGARFINTMQVISPQVKSSQYEDETRDAKQFSIPATYGLGAGMLFRLTDNIFLDLGAAYSWGTRAKYVAIKDVHQEGNELRYPTHKTSTDKLLFRAGISFRLSFESSDCCDCNDSDTDYYYERGSDNKPAPREESGKKQPNILQKNPAPKADY